ncbi:hypothetical protein B0I35DRAFT_411444 [Stachybotrys elegans]|uniref:CCHC-type domain-containing protein n=1 Tax=Stachybotrys elegans TaxID=80388 RepID=A0A8K0SP01_9HYPO|nr:hypothetical protein B0I35DRAFT_411444 [Stachybotrys elegans]
MSGGDQQQGPPSLFTGLPSPFTGPPQYRNTPSGPHATLIGTRTLQGMQWSAATDDDAIAESARRTTGAPAHVPTVTLMFLDTSISIRRRLQRESDSRFAYLERRERNQAEARDANERRRDAPRTPQAPSEAPRDARREAGQVSRRRRRQRRASQKQRHNDRADNRSRDASEAPRPDAGEARAADRTAPRYDEAKEEFEPRPHGPFCGVCGREGHKVVDCIECNHADGLLHGCTLCNEQHDIGTCTKFLALSDEEKIATILHGRVNMPPLYISNQTTWHQIVYHHICHSNLFFKEMPITERHCMWAVSHVNPGVGLPWYQYSRALYHTGEPEYFLLKPQLKSGMTAMEFFCKEYGYEMPGRECQGQVKTAAAQPGQVHTRPLQMDRMKDSDTSLDPFDIDME